MVAPEHARFLAAWKIEPDVEPRIGSSTAAKLFRMAGQGALLG
jgi:hypothetical protein